MYLWENVLGTQSLSRLWILEMFARLLVFLSTHFLKNVNAMSESSVDPGEVCLASSVSFMLASPNWIVSKRNRNAISEPSVDGCLFGFLCAFHSTILQIIYYKSNRNAMSKSSVDPGEVCLASSASFILSSPNIFIGKRNRNVISKSSVEGGLLGSMCVFHSGIPEFIFWKAQ